MVMPICSPKWLGLIMDYPNGPFWTPYRSATWSRGHNKPTRGSQHRPSRPKLVRHSSVEHTSFDQGCSHLLLIMLDILTSHYVFKCFLLLYKVLYWARNHLNFDIILSIRLVHKSRWLCSFIDSEGWGNNSVGEHYNLSILDLQTLRRDSTGFHQPPNEIRPPQQDVFRVHRPRYHIRCRSVYTC